MEKDLVLSGERTIRIRCEINPTLQDVLSTAIEDFDKESDEPIIIWLDSTGGSYYGTSMLSDSIKFAKSEVRCIVKGFAMSMAFYLLQACDVRLAYPSSVFMFHGIKPDNPPRADDPDFDHSFQSAKKKTEELLQSISKRTGQPIRKIRAWSKVEREFTAQEALELNFIDEILVPPKKK